MLSLCPLPLRVCGDKHRLGHDSILSCTFFCLSIRSESHPYPELPMLYSEMLIQIFSIWTCFETICSFSEEEPPIPPLYLWSSSPSSPSPLPADCHHQEPNTWFMWAQCLLRSSPFHLADLHHPSACAIQVSVETLWFAGDWSPSYNTAMKLREIFVPVSGYLKLRFQSTESSATLFLLLQGFLYLFATWAIPVVIIFASLLQAWK